MLIVIMLGANIVLNVIMQNVEMLNVIKLCVVAPLQAS